MLENYAEIIEFTTVVDGEKLDHRVVHYGEFVQILNEIAKEIHSKVEAGEGMDNLIPVTQIFTLVHGCTKEPFEVGCKCECMIYKQDMMPTFTWNREGKATVH